MSLLTSAAPDFTDPLGMLSACHQRMLGFCELLERLPDWIVENGVDAEATTAAQRIIRYFDTAGRLHHQDEEQDLFPMLINDPKLGVLIAELRAQHADLEQYWQALRGPLVTLVEKSENPAGLAASIAPFCAAYRAHIEREETQLLPRARSLLDATQQALLGEYMAQRRQ